MEQAIKKKFGDDVFRKIEQRVDSLVLQGQGDREAFYPGGSDAIEQYLACNLNFPDELESMDIVPTVFVKVTIDTAGRAKEVSIVKSFNDKFDREALRVLTTMEGWEPAIENRIKKESAYGLQIRFDPRIKRKCKP
ncbi:TonB family protein [Pseudochryseolinea flava]|nr:TonB family protein [Pseudochryseolinea flava]